MTSYHLRCCRLFWPTLHHNFTYSSHAYIYNNRYKNSSILLRMKRFLSLGQNHDQSLASQRNNRRFSRSTRIVVGIIFASGIAYGLNLIPDLREFTDTKHYYNNLSIRIQNSLLVQSCLNLSSGIVGYLSHCTIYPSFRKPFYGLYTWLFGCRMDEAAQELFQLYPTFAAFFNRALKEKVRPISHSLLVSPADGTVLHFGEIKNRRVEFVKHYDFEIHEFLGPINVDTKIGNALYQIVIYLSPGDYHAFHSPTTWNVYEKIHFPGFLFSVRPSKLRRNLKLFCQNERVVLSGHWQHGYFSMTAVAALNVGDIVILDEPAKNRKMLETESFDIYNEKMRFGPGEKVGEFRMGSTIVLIFEAPENIEFCIKAGDRLRYGQSLLLQGANSPF